MSNYNSNTAVVRQVQTAINAAGYSPLLTIDGAYGPKTIAGVKWYQSHHGLAADGIIGPQTVAATVSVAPSSMASNPLAALQAQIAQLQGGASPTPAAPSTALVSLPVMSLRPAVTLFGPAPAATVDSVFGPAPVATLDNVKPPPGSLQSTGDSSFHLVPLPPHLVGGVSIPAGAITLAGVVVGAIVSFPIGALLGGVVGLAADMGLTFLPGSIPAAATMHGEVDESEFDFGFDADFGYDPDDTDDIIAGDIGVPTKHKSLKG